MAQSLDVNVFLGSEMGFTMPKDNRLADAANIGIPEITTIRNFEGDVFPIPTEYILAISPRLQVDDLDDFVTTTLVTSTYQTVVMTNIGNGILTITNILASSNAAIISPQFNFTSPNVFTTTTPITILPGNTATFELAYVGWPGVYDSNLYLVSNNTLGIYKINTHQIVNRSYSLVMPVTSLSTTTTQVGKKSLFKYVGTPVVDTFYRNDLIFPLIGTITGSPAWTIVNTVTNARTNAISVQFNPNTVNNVNGTYTSTMLIRSVAGVNTVTVFNSVTIDIDPAKNKNLSSWLSPAGHFNSIIGMSYDLINGTRNLTIGVGNTSGVLADTTTTIVTDLGLGREYDNYPSWSKVYRIPISTSTTSTVYYSNNHVVKTTATTTVTDYSVYFGENDSVGSMFIIESIGYGSVRVKMNNLTADLDLFATYPNYDDWTLKNLTQAFYYYANSDVTFGRYSPLPTEYASPRASNSSTTYLFLGFDYNNKTNTATVKTSILPIPT